MTKKSEKLIAILAFCFFLVTASCVGQESQATVTTAVSIPPTRAAIDQQFVDELQNLAAWCRENNIAEKADETLATFLVRDPGRLYLFLPTAPRISFAETPIETERVWQQKILTARQNYATALLRLAKDLAGSGQGAEAFQMVHESLHWNPESKEAREAIGHRLTEEGWQPYSERLKVKVSSRQHPLTNWSSGSYLQVSTDNFEIASTADEETTLRLAEQLQRWHWVWRQVFFDYWSSSQNLTRWLDGKSPARGDSKKFEVVFFGDRDSYLQTLAPQIPGIEASTGYYSDQFQATFFYASDEQAVEETWRHELTHQLFKESVRTESSPFEEGFLWLGEGIAMYMESLRDFGPFVTLGGFDSRRLQYARVRKLREDFHIPLDQLNTMPRSEFQQNPDVRRVYSEAAGICNFLMHSEGGAFRNKLVELLGLIYRGNFKASNFEKVLGISTTEIDQRYSGFLQVNSVTVKEYLIAPEAITELALPGADLDESAFQSIGQCRELQWLDIGGSTLTVTKAKLLVGCAKLDQLFLTRSQIKDGAIEALRQFSHLNSLDLTASKIEAAALMELPMLDGLRELSLAQTGVDDTIIGPLRKMKNLQSVDLTNTNVTSAGRQQIQMALPNLKIIQRP